MNYLAFVRVLLRTKLLHIVANIELRLQKFLVQFCSLAEEQAGGGPREATWPIRLGTQTIRDPWSSVSALYEAGRCSKLAAALTSPRDRKGSTHLKVATVEEHRSRGPLGRQLEMS